MPDGGDQLALRGSGDVTAGPGSGPVAGKPRAAAAADVGPASEGRGEAAAPQRRDPSNLDRIARLLPAALIALDCSRLLA